MIDLIILIMLIIIAYGIGNLIKEILNIDNLTCSENTLLCFGLGFGTLCLLVFMLGVMGLLLRKIVFPLFICMFIIYLIRNIKKIPLFIKYIYNKLVNYHFNFYHIIFYIFILYAAYNLFECLTPVINGDSLSAYLQVPSLYVKKGAIYNIDWMSWDDLPIYIHMLSSLGLLLSSDILAQLITGWLMGILCSLAIYTITRNVANKEISIITAIIFYTIPTLSWLIFSVKIDLGYTFFELSFWALFIKWLTNGNFKYLYISGILLGFAIGSKYHAFFALLFGVGVVIFKLLKSNFTIKQSVKPILIFISIVAAISMPCYIKNYIYTGDPVYPFLTNPSWGSDENVNSYKQPWEYIRYQYNIITGKDFFINHFSMSDKPIGIVPFLFFPLIFWNLSKRATKTKLIVIILCVYYIFLSGIMFLSVWPYPRHILPAIGLLVVSSSVCINKAYLILKRDMVIIILSVILIGTILMYDGLPIGSKSQFRFKHQLEYFQGKITKEEYLRLILFDRENSAHMNTKMIQFVDTLEKDARVLTLDYGNGYYVPRPLIKIPELMSESDINTLLRKMRDNRITYIYYSKSNIIQLYKQLNIPMHIVLNDDYSYIFDVIYNNNDQYLLKVNYDSINK